MGEVLFLMYSKLVCLRKVFMFNINFKIVIIGGGFVGVICGC